jgi:SAM-dependent methyltransferase
MRDPSETWTGKASSYDRVRPTPPPALLDLLTQLIDMPRPALVVDLGSGTGLSTAIWGERAERVIGIEPNADMRELDRLAQESTSRLMGLIRERGLAPTIKIWPENKSLNPLRESGQFRFTREVFLHNIEQGDATRFLEMMRSSAFSGQFQFTEQEIGFDRIRQAALQYLGSEPVPWYISYRVRIGVK